MRLKYYLRGAGIGVVVTTVILAIIFALNPKTVSDDEIRQRAALLGMVEVSEAYAQSGAQDSPGKEVAASDGNTDENSNVSDEASSDTDNLLGDLGADETAGDPDTDVTSDDAAADDATADNSSADAGSTENTEESGKKDKDKNNKKDKKDKDNKKEDKSTDENTKTEADTDADTDAPDKTVASEETDTTEKLDTTEKTDAADNASNVSNTNKNTKTIKIYNGNVSSTVAGYLYKAGLVDSASDFDNYIQNVKKDRIIMCGTFEIPVGASYDEIINIITKERN
ncbi:MAG: hypothetical protein IKQ56_01375 [Lachnospiraceae bacterium]|nr:hypothetical protein [Lachnospiraceae bacterium]